jgi:hypothetical protein
MERSVRLTVVSVPATKKLPFTVRVAPMVTSPFVLSTVPADPTTTSPLEVRPIANLAAEAKSAGEENVAPPANLETPSTSRVEAVNPPLALIAPEALRVDVVIPAVNRATPPTSRVLSRVTPPTTSRIPATSTRAPKVEPVDA